VEMDIVLHWRSLNTQNIHYLRIGTLGMYLKHLYNISNIIVLNERNGIVYFKLMFINYVCLFQFNRVLPEY